MAPEIVIVFDHPAAVFFPGQTITGRVAVENDKQRKCHGVSIKFNGSAHVQFSETTSTNERTSNSEGTSNNEGTQTTTYTADEQYYKAEMMLWTDPQEQLMAGSFQLPFNFILPTTSAPTFAMEHGHVSHYCEAKVLLGTLSFDVKCTAPYVVNAFLDLNANPANKCGQQLQKDKTLCCLCCRSGPVSAVVRLDRTGYVPGDAIVVSGEVNNSSRRNVLHTKAELFMIVLFKTKRKDKKETLSVASLQQPGIPAGEDCIWPGHQLIVPPLGASGLPGCSIIDVTYELKFTVQPAYTPMPLVLDFPVTIGTIPLADTFQTISRDPHPSAPSYGFS